MKREKIIGIYKITSPSGKIYIGQSLDIHYRWNSHYLKLRCKTQPKLYKSFLEHGVENHSFEIIHKLESSDSNKLEVKIELNKLEVHYIKLFDCFDKSHGLNLTSGGGKNILVSDETKRRLRESHLGQEAWNKGIPFTEEHRLKFVGENNPMYGKRGEDCHNFGRKHTAEQNKQNSERFLGKKLTPESIAKREETKRIKRDKQKADGTYIPMKHSDEFRLKLSELYKGKSINKGKKQTEEHKLNRVKSRKLKREERISNGTYVKAQWSEESKQKMCETQKGKKRSKESIDKQIETKKRIRQERLTMIF